MIIRDPRNGDGVYVDSKNRLFVNAKSSPLQHIVSEEEGQAYQVFGETTWAAASGAQNVLHIKNTSTSKNLVVTYIRLQIVTDLTLPNANSYFTIESGETYSSGGSAVTPVNMNRGSANVADTTVYDSNPTLTGTSIELDKVRVKASGDVITFNKEGALIVQPTNTIKITFTPSGSHTATAYSRVSFTMEAPGQ